MSLCSADEASDILVEYPEGRVPRGPRRRLRHQPGLPDAVDLKPARLVVRAPAGLRRTVPLSRYVHSLMDGAETPGWAASKVMLDNEAERTRKAQPERSASPDATNRKKRVHAEPTYPREYLNVSKDEYDTKGQEKSQRTVPLSRYVHSLMDGAETPGWAASKVMLDNEAERTRKAQPERSASPDATNRKKRVHAEPTYPREYLNVSKDEYDTKGQEKSQRTVPLSRYVHSLMDGAETPGWAASKVMLDNEAERTRKAQPERSASPDATNRKKRVHAEPTYPREYLNVSKDEYDTKGQEKSQRTVPLSRYVHSLMDGAETPGWAASKVMLDNEAERTRKAQPERSASPDATNRKKRVHAEPTYPREYLNVSKDEYDTKGQEKSQRTVPLSRYVHSLMDGAETPGWAASKVMLDNEAERTRKAQPERSASPDATNRKKRVHAEPTYPREYLNVSKDEYDTKGQEKSQRTVPLSRYVHSLMDGAETPGWAASKVMLDNEAERTRKAQPERSASPDATNRKKIVHAEPTYPREYLNVSKDEYDTKGPEKSQLWIRTLEPCWGQTSKGKCSFTHLTLWSATTKIRKQPQASPLMTVGYAQNACLMLLTWMVVFSSLTPFQGVGSGRSNDVSYLKFYPL
ncbi:uncharacterized protein [Dermacentor andersoni]|uniref:uncharacterized protein isoform X2 n=1 Tax=Dermacentor andersoni TaxID=34620 RepID=UPI002416FAA0|nr:uncharacterized protein LOC126544016 isoform X2 [Dermacentor andersoni]